MKHPATFTLQYPADRQTPDFAVSRPMFLGRSQQAPFPQSLFQGSQGYRKLVPSIPRQPLDYSIGAVGLEIDSLTVQPADVLPLGPQIGAGIVASANLHLPPAPGGSLLRPVTVAARQVRSAAADGRPQQLQEPADRVGARLVFLLGR